MRLAFNYMGLEMEFLLFLSFYPKKHRSTEHTKNEEEKEVEGTAKAQVKRQSPATRKAKRSTNPAPDAQGQRAKPNSTNSSFKIPRLDSPTTNANTTIMEHHIENEKEGREEEKEARKAKRKAKLPPAKGRRGGNKPNNSLAKKPRLTTYQTAHTNQLEDADQSRADHAFVNFEKKEKDGTTTPKLLVEDNDKSTTISSSEGLHMEEQLRISPQELVPVDVKLGIEDILPDDTLGNGHSRQGDLLGVLPAELLALILNHAGDLTWPCCQFVSLRWRQILANLSKGKPHLFPRPDAKYTRRVAWQGWLSVLQWARANGCPWDEETCGAAAKNGHLEVLQWARANECPWDETTCTLAAVGGHLEVLKWARANGCPWNTLTCAGAAKEGHLEVLKWARANGCSWDTATCALAAKGGYLEILKWARANGCPWNKQTCAKAAEGGHLEVLKWARANGCPWNSSTCNSAAWFGNLEILRWARANGCPWNEVTCASAAGGGHLEVLKWVRANGCPWDASTCDFAVSEGHLEVLKWVRANGCPWGLIRPPASWRVA